MIIEKKLDARNYPLRRWDRLRGAYRRIYVRVPVCVTRAMIERHPCPSLLIEGKFMAVDVQLTGYSMLFAPTMYETFEDCQRACNAGNQFHGIKQDLYKKVLQQSLNS